MERAKGIVKAALFVSGARVSLTRLEEVSLEITARNQESIPSVKKHDDFLLKDGMESEFEFLVPDNIRSFVVTLSAKVRPFSAAPGSDPITLTHSETFELNNIDSSQLLEDAHLSYSLNEGYRIHVLGKTGEPKRNRVLQLQFVNRFLLAPTRITLQSDHQGLIELGDLEEIDQISAVNAQTLSPKTWNIQKDCNGQSQHILANRGQPIKVAFSEPHLKQERVSFLEIDASDHKIVLHDRFADVSLKDGYLLLGSADNKLPVGTYRLRFREQTRKSVLPSPTDL